MQTVSISIMIKITLLLKIIYLILDIKNNFLDQSGVIEVNIDHDESCQNAVQCFAEQLVQCTAEQEVLQMKLRLTPILQLSFHSQHPLFNTKNSTIDSVFLNLKLDTSETRYDIKQTKTLKNQSFSESITKEVMYYQNEHTNWKRKLKNSQFKSIHEVHGTLSLNSKNGSFFRGILQFVQCGKSQLFGFIRHQQTLYQIRPQWKNETQAGKLKLIILTVNNFFVSFVKVKTFTSFLLLPLILTFQTVFLLLLLTQKKKVLKTK